ncbi:MAG: glycosyltransferase family 117 protein [Gemmatimonadales bacterium]
MVALAVLVGYLITLAPTVTFWDAGEFITAAKTLGIPHPPGTPMFVLLANVWGRLIPFGAYAWRINLLSAACGALTAGFWFLVVHDIIGRLHAGIDRRSRAAFACLGGVAAAMLSAFSYTAWQNSNETEVYAAATLAIAVVAWLATRWRHCRGDTTGSRLLLVALYLGALSVGTHLMGLLVGPALIATLVVTARCEPLLDEDEQRREWARIVVIAVAWILLIGVGLGNAALTMAGAVLLAGSGVRAARVRQLGFVVVAGLIVVAGVSTLAFLLLRAQQHPWLNQGTPATWHQLLGVIRRAQYPPRTPLDDPTVIHGLGNPGRSLTLLAYQLGNYAQYFDWQWASGIGELTRASFGRLAITLLMATLGIHGAFAQRRADPPSFALVGAVFLVAGPVLVLYLNFKPGPSIGWDRWTHLADHEVRDRDYFFVASFMAWGIWIAIGLADLARTWIPRLGTRMRRAMVGAFGVALIPLAVNFRTATRRQTPEATLARDFAHALLQSVPPDGVLFTRGDNDTFPLWYAQQVEGFRPDVSVVCLSLAQTAWYIKQIRDQPHIDATREMLAPAWRDAPLIVGTRPLHGLTDRAIDGFRPFRAAKDLTLDLGSHGVVRGPAGAIVNPQDITVSEVLRENAGYRPVAWSITAADALYGLGPHLIQQGMALVMSVGSVDSATLAGGDALGPGGTPLDLSTTRELIDKNWWFGKLESGGSARLDANIQAVASTIAAPMTQVGRALLGRGDTAAAVTMLRRAVRLADDSTANALLRRLRP